MDHLEEIEEEPMVEDSGTNEEGDPEYLVLLMNQLVHDGLLTLEEALEVLHGAGITTEEYADAEYLQPGEEDDDEDEDEGEAECENENGDSDSDGPPTKRVSK